MNAARNWAGWSHESIIAWALAGVAANSNETIPLGEGNLISGNGYAGVNLTEPHAVGNRIIRVVGNYIGTEVSGKTTLGDAGVGVLIELGWFSNTLHSDVIVNGVMIADWGSWGNEIIGNFIGVDTTGSFSLEGFSNGIGLGPFSSGSVERNSGKAISSAAMV